MVVNYRFNRECNLKKQTVLTGAVMLCSMACVIVTAQNSAPTLKGPTRPSAARPEAQEQAPKLTSVSTSGNSSGQPAVSTAQSGDDSASDDEVVRVSTNLINVPTQVMDRDGRFIPNLKKEDFQIFENGVEQDVANFSSFESPFTVALMLDVSGSTATQLQAIRLAANAFIGRLRSNDQLLIVSFDGRISVLCEATKVSDLRKRKLRIDALNEGTVLYDAVNLVLNQRLSRISGRKAIVLLTDGVDEGSKQASMKKNLRDAEEADALVYSVQYNTLPELPERLSRAIADPKSRARKQSQMERQYAVGSQYLRSLADRTGGRIYFPTSLADIQKAFGAITEELGRQYSLGYYPKMQARAHEMREIKVRVRIPNLVVHARESYVSNGTQAAQIQR